MAAWRRNSAALSFELLMIASSSVRALGLSSEEFLDRLQRSRSRIAALASEVTVMGNGLALWLTLELSPVLNEPGAYQSALSDVLTSRAKELLCRGTGWLRRERLVTQIAF